MENIKENIILEDKKVYESKTFLDLDEKMKTNNDENKLSLYMIFWSSMLLVAGIVACAITNEWKEIIDNLLLMWLSPSKLVTDYFNVGSLASTFVNAALCGFGCNLMIYITKAKRSATLLAGYFLVIAHCFYGLNFLNMWLPFFAIFLYAIVFKKRIGDILHLSMFATSLAPFISDFLFRYTIGDSFVFGSPQVTIGGIIISVIFSLGAGFLIPALLNEMTKMHRGHNLYKAGLAIGFFGFFAHALFYKTFNVATPDSVVREVANYESNLNMIGVFVICFFAIMFISTFLFGFVGNKCSLKGYSKVWKCDGWRDDFPSKFGFNLTQINIGLYGLGLLALLSIVVACSDKLHFVGPVAGAMIAAITFSASGQTLKNVWPIALGYAIFFVIVFIICELTNICEYNEINFQAYISAFAFATGLCPFSGRYSRKIGVIAGIIDAIIATSTVALHGGFVLYNGGFTAGLTAMLLICVLDFYHIEPKEIED